MSDSDKQDVVKNRLLLQLETVESGTPNPTPDPDPTPNPNTDPDPNPDPNTVWWEPSGLS